MNTNAKKDYTTSYNKKCKPENLLQLGKGIDNNTRVHRVFKLEYFMQLFENKKNTLVKTIEWEDPWENFLLKQSIQGHPSGLSVSLETIMQKYYGQCWTFKEKDDDALWRIYSPDQKGVRVTTKLGKLWDDFYDVNITFAPLSYFLGQVQYLSEKEIKDYFENTFRASDMPKNQTGKSIIESLLIKRKEFEHEKELRLIYTNDNHANPFYKYTINPNDFIEEVLFDPRMNDNDIQQIKLKLINTYGFEGIIKKSPLYQIPNLRIQW